MVIIIPSTSLAFYAFHKEPGKQPTNQPTNTTNPPPTTTTETTNHHTSEKNHTTPPPEKHTLLIFITDNNTNTPIQHATITIGDQTNTTNTTGTTTLTVTKLTTYTITATATGYQNYTNTITYTQFQEGTIYIHLQPITQPTTQKQHLPGYTLPPPYNPEQQPSPQHQTATGTISGRILYDDNLLTPIYNATVLINGHPADIYGTTYLALNVTEGTATIIAHNAAQTTTQTITVKPNNVTTANILFPTTPQGTPPTITMPPNHLRINWTNGLTLELNMTQDRILGIGAVQLNGTPLRNPQMSGPLTLQKIQNGTYIPLTITKCQYTSNETTGNTAIIHTTLITTDGNITVNWIFTPWQLTADSTTYQGLGYRFTITSPINISTLGCKCSWELNTNISGTTLLTRREKTPWERTITLPDSFTISSTYLLGQSQPPDYHYDNTGGEASYIWPPADLSNNLQKTTGSNQLYSYDQFFLGKTHHANTSYRVILYANHGNTNDYTTLYDRISTLYRSFYGIQEVQLNPSVITRDYLTAPPGQPFPFISVADTMLPEFASHYFKHVNVLSIWKSNGRLGNPYNGNRLATHSIDVCTEDTTAIQYFINKAHTLGMQFSVWLSTCYAQDSPTLPVNQWKIVNVNGDIPTGPTNDIYLIITPEDS